MSYEEAVRIAAELDGSVIPHSSFQRADEGVTRCIIQSRYNREPECCAVIGPSGSGKTLLCDVQIERMPRKQIVEGDHEITCVPAFFTSIDSPTDVKALPRTILKQLGHEDPGTYDLLCLNDMIKDNLATQRSEVMFIDEFHKLINRGRRAVHINKRVCQWVQGLTNKSPTTICLVGTEEVEAIIRSDPELARRFPNVFTLRALSPGTRASPGDIQWYLTELAKKAVEKCQIEAFPDFSNYLVALSSYAATSGSPSYIGKLLKQSVIIVLTSATRIVTTETLAQVWDSGILSSASLAKTNPFRMTEVQLAACFRK
jgi:hypothetical protein